jgi:hypothetical protein
LQVRFLPRLPVKPFLPIVLSNRWAKLLSTLSETEMGSQVVSVILTDGRKFDQVVVDSGYIMRARGYTKLPFAESEIVDIEVTRDKWNWEEEPAGSRGKLKGP